MSAENKDKEGRVEAVCFVVGNRQFTSEVGQVSRGEKTVKLTERVQTGTIFSRNLSTGEEEYHGPEDFGDILDPPNDLQVLTAEQAEKLGLEETKDGQPITKARYDSSRAYGLVDKQTKKRGGDPDAQIGPKYTMGGWMSPESRKDHEERVREPKDPLEGAIKREPPVSEGNGMIW